MNELIHSLNERYTNATTEELLRGFLSEYKGSIALSSSLSIEDQALTNMIIAIDPKAMVFTLDTGRLFPETYDLIHRTNAKYGIKMKIYFPEASTVEEMVNTKGINLFFENVENRKMCCQVRKIGPLKRAFSTLKVWICGLRRDINFGGSVITGNLSFKYLDHDRRISGRKSDNATNFDVTSGENTTSLFNHIRFNTHRSDIIFQGNLTLPFQIFIGHCWVKNRMINHFSKFINFLIHTF